MYMYGYPVLGGYIPFPNDQPAHCQGHSGKLEHLQLACELDPFISTASVHKTNLKWNSAFFFLL